MKKVLLGIDPGKAGFITVYCEGEFEFYPMPTHRVETEETTAKGKIKMKTEFHEEGLRQIVFDIWKDHQGAEFHCVIEQVNGRHGWSAENNFNFGHVAGMQKMIPIMLGAKLYPTRPQKWQNVMYQGFEKVMKKSDSGKTMVHDTKATSAIVAKALGPEIDFRKSSRAKNIDDNKTDSFLMCLYLKNHILSLP